MKRTSWLSPIRVTRDELAQIKRFAANYSLTMSQYMRLSALQLLREEPELQRIYARDTRLK